MTPRETLPYLPLYTGDFLKATSGMSLAERGAYTALICYQWDNQSVPDDLDRLFRAVVAVSPTEKRATEHVRGSRFERSPDGDWRCRWIEDARIAANKRVTANRANGQKGGRPKNPLSNPTETQHQTHGLASEAADRNPRKTISDPTSDPKHSPTDRSAGIGAPPPVAPDEPPPTEREGVEAALQYQANQFLDWFEAEYPKRRNGARFKAKNGDVEKVRGLLAIWEPARLRQLAEVLLLLDADADQWVATTDRGIGVLDHRATWLDQRLAAVEARR